MTIQITENLSYAEFESKQPLASLDNKKNPQTLAECGWIMLLLRTD
jgi:hypothetical protein